MHDSSYCSRNKKKAGETEYGKFRTRKGTIWMNMKVFLAHFDDTIGYDVEILNENATIQDYLDELNNFQDRHVESCKGCDGCCWERIPLTSFDVLKYLEDPIILKELHGCPNPLTAFIHDYCHVAGHGPVIDIRLKRNPDQSCIFLNREEKCCLRHRSRSLVCQSFVCLPHSEKAGQLRDTLLNIGEDDLVHRYLQEAKAKGADPVVHENNNAAPSLKDYPANIFAGKKHYQEIKIKDAVPENLWRQLMKATP